MKISLLIIIFLSSLLTFNLNAQEATLPKREMRGVWIATVDNIDWPSKMGLSARKQKNEYIELLNSLEKVNMNAVIFQVRPQADAFYKSSFEPWSEYLTGKQGVAPADSINLYDPLQFIIEETHKRGIEFHAWLNPYRISIYEDLTRLDSNHIYFKHPEWFVKYGTRYYFNPGLKESKEFVLKVVKEIVANYDVDAIHFDDYFYPYEIKDTPFPDSVQYAKYIAQFDSITHTKIDTFAIPAADTVEYKFVETKNEFDNIKDWRRGNVNSMVKDVYHTIKSTKPWVKFGISPFGVWRNKSADPIGSETRARQTNYDNLYADVLYWLDKGWVDYITPQLYWRIGEKSPVPFDVLAKWWSELDTDAKLFIGQGCYKFNPKSKFKFWRTTEGYSKQIEILRANDKIEGSMHFSAKYFKSNPLNMVKQLSNNEYRKPAIAPAYPNAKINTFKVKNIKVSGNTDDGVKLQWKDIADGNIRYYLVYRFEGEETGDMTVANHIIAKVAGYGMTQQFIDRITDISNKYTYVVTCVDRFNVESEASDPITIKIKRRNIIVYDNK